MDFSSTFDQASLSAIFPPERTRDFFDALFGDDAEGSFDIKLAYKDWVDAELRFEFQLKQREGKCLACNLTYGLPQVFSRHPVLDVNNVVQQITGLLPEHNCVSWELGRTREVSAELHVIPLLITVEPDGQ